MNNHLSISKPTQKINLPKRPNQRNNHTLLKQLQQKINNQLVGQKKVEFLNQSIIKPNKKILSHILRQWSISQLNNQNQFSRTDTLFQNQLPKYLSIKQSDQKLSKGTISSQSLESILLQYDFSLKCQVTGCIPSQPARTSKCRFLCVVDRKVLEEIGICSCGREVEKFQNQIVEDWVLALVVNYYKTISNQRNTIQQLQMKNDEKPQIKLLNSQWKGLIRIHLDSKDFQFIFD